MSRASKIARLLAVLAAIAQGGLLLWLFVRRAAYPYDLEWMEGGMLCHSLRLLAHQPLYAPPSVDFIPYLYTPLYPSVVALLSKVSPGGVTYALGRFVSIASYLGATAIGWRFAARWGGSRAAATVAMAIPAAAFALTGTWYDLARPDSLWLLLVTAAMALVYSAARTVDGQPRRSHLRAALAGALLVAAFLAKQTATPFMIAGGLALLLLEWRLVFAYGAALAILGLPSLWLLNKGSDGWFWTYVFQLHQSHEFYARRAFLETPWQVPPPGPGQPAIPGLFKILGPSLIVIPWAISRRRSAAVLFATFLAAVGIAASCIAFGTQWAFTNAFIPGVFFLAIAIGVCAGRLVALPRSSASPSTPSVSAIRDGAYPPRLRPLAVFLLLAASLALHPYDPRPFVPTAADRAAGDRLVAKLRAATGEVFIPFHPFYAHLAGKRTYLHRMGVLDIGAAGLGPPRGLVEATRDHRWSLAVFDDKVATNWHYFPHFLDEYQMLDEHFAGPRVVSGAQTVPTFVLAPRRPRPPQPPTTTPTATATPTVHPDEDATARAPRREAAPGHAAAGHPVGDREP